jgi:hypothetical protein
MKIGLLADSSGDIDALDRGTELLLGKGAERLFFLGGRYPDVDEMILQRRSRRRGSREYSDADFVDDVAAFLGASQGGTRARLAGADEEDKVRSRFSRVPCKDSLEYRDPKVPNALVEMVGDLLACLVHDKGDLARDDMVNAVLLFHGKSPEPGVVQIGPRYFMTPGRLTGAAEQCCALLEVLPAELRFEGFTLDGKSIKALQFPRGSRNKTTIT